MQQQRQLYGGGVLFQRDDDQMCEDEGQAPRTGFNKSEKFNHFIFSSNHHPKDRTVPPFMLQSDVIGQSGVLLDDVTLHWITSDKAGLMERQDCQQREDKLEDMFL